MTRQDVNGEGKPMLLLAVALQAPNLRHCIRIFISISLIKNFGLEF